MKDGPTLRARAIRRRAYRTARRSATYGLRDQPERTGRACVFAALLTAAAAAQGVPDPQWDPRRTRWLRRHAEGR